MEHTSGIVCESVAKRVSASAGRTRSPTIVLHRMSNKILRDSTSILQRSTGYFSNVCNEIFHTWPIVGSQHLRSDPQLLPRK